MSTVNRGSFIFSFPICISFMSFSCLIAFTTTSNMMWSSNGEREHPCLFPYLKGKAPISHCYI